MKASPWPRGDGTEHSEPTIPSPTAQLGGQVAAVVGQPWATLRARKQTSDMELIASSSGTRFL
jgi:hypothetical protein